MQHCSCVSICPSAQTTWDNPIAGANKRRKDTYQLTTSKYLAARVSCQKRPSTGETEYQKKRQSVEREKGRLCVLCFIGTDAHVIQGTEGFLRVIAPILCLLPLLATCRQK